VDTNINEFVNDNVDVGDDEYDFMIRKQIWDEQSKKECDFWPGWSFQLEGVPDILGIIMI
jgi:hypothetical protein